MTQNTYRDLNISISIIIDLIMWLVDNSDDSNDVY